MLIPIDTNIALKRETSSGAIINTDISAYNSIKKQKEARQEKECKIQQELDELKRLLNQLMGAKNERS